MSNSKKSKDTATQPASDSKPLPVPAHLLLNEETAKRALIEARGDIFIASQILSITATRLNRAIQVSAVLQSAVDAIAVTQKGVSEETVRQAVESRIALGRVVGLDGLIDLASMPIEENSAQNQVKLAAAARLAGDASHGSTGGEMAETFKELSDLYQKHAPRVRLVRERTTLEISGPAEHDVTSVPPQE